MTRPEHFRCENCAFWGWVPGTFIKAPKIGRNFEEAMDAIDAAEEDDSPGVPLTKDHLWPCRVRAPRKDRMWPRTKRDEWCGEFRAEWPEPREFSESVFKPVFEDDV